MKKKRYPVLDGIRGVTLLSMILYHATWDLVYLFGKNISWYRKEPGAIWQQSICWMFILLSGFCWQLGKKKWKRAAVVFGAGLLITFATLIFMPQNRVVFGVLTLLGSCMFIMIPLHKILQRVPPVWGFVGSLLFAGVFYPVNDGYLGFFQWEIFRLPEGLYANLWTTYLGFPAGNFYSTDYFSVLPWFFVFSAGYFLYGLMQRCEKMQILGRKTIRPLEWVGRHSLLIYLLHQPVLYGLFILFY